MSKDNTPSNSELEKVLESTELAVINLYGEFYEEALSLLFRATKQLIQNEINKQVKEARIDERIMQGEEDNSESYRRARLVQLWTTK